MPDQPVDLVFDGHVLAAIALVAIACVVVLLVLALINAEPKAKGR
jgi:hypothetical protein